MEHSFTLQLSHLIIFFSCFTVSAIPTHETDLRALLAIKASILHDPLNALTSWNETSTNFCTWNGIFCANRKHPNRVMGIYLNSQGLVGPLSPYIGNLSFLRTIDLRNNTFTGLIPEEIGFLRRLEYVEISNNSFTGQIPKNLSQCTNLFYLNVIDNKLSGDIIPRELSILPKLEAFGFTYNTFLGSIPHFIGNFTSLTRLSMAHCNLIGEIPESLSQLRSLTFIQLGMNNLMGKIPLGLFNTSSITYFGMAFNNLQGGIPDNIGSTLPNLQRLQINSNQFTGEVPTSLPNASSLESIFLSDNNFVGSMPKQMGELSLLFVFSITDNHIKDDFKFIDSFTNCTNLNVLEVGQNLLSGSIPAAVRFLTNLVELDLSNNNLSGVIPNSIDGCKSLQWLNLEGNSLVGEIPSGLFDLIGLKGLDLSQNKLNGNIPSFLSELQLQYLNLSFNDLHGEVPTKGVFADKSAISLDGNRELCGGIPELKLPSCLVAKSELKHSSTPIKILIPVIVGGLIFLLLSSYFIRFTCKKRNSTIETTVPAFDGIQILRLSYSNILKATNVFSEANLLGVGRFGSVYKGILDDGKILIAVKVLKLTVRGASKTFLAECHALKSIRHRNLLKILSACDSIDFQGNDFKALIYEFKANGSLENWLHPDQERETAERVRKLNLVQRLNIAIDVAHGIEYLHSGTDKTIIHGDLKPSNILLDDDMNAHVGDFGLAKIITSTIPSPQSSSSSAIKGTVGYVAPEYGTSNLVSTQGDVYSYGILLLELFTNRRPTDDLFHDHLNLHIYVSSALPDRVTEIVDLDSENEHNTREDDDKVGELVGSVLSIGVACSKENPRDRVSMEDVVIELSKIREGFMARPRRRNQEYLIIYG